MVATWQSPAAVGFIYPSTDRRITFLREMPRNTNNAPIPLRNGALLISFGVVG